MIGYFFISAVLLIQTCVSELTKTIETKKDCDTIALVSEKKPDIEKAIKQTLTNTKPKETKKVINIKYTAKIETVYLNQSNLLDKFYIPQNNIYKAMPTIIKDNIEIVPIYDQVFIYDLFLIYMDIYLITKPRYVVNSFYDETGKLVSNEKNLLADMFFRNNLWEVGFCLAALANFGGIYVCNQLDSSGLLATAYTITLTLAEFYAINSWENYMKNVIPKNVNISCPILTLKF